LPAGNKAGKPPKQGVFHGNISLCLSLRPYILDTVAISAIAEGRHAAPGAGGMKWWRATFGDASSARVGEMP
jgi:hypothetical protein